MASVTEFSSIFTSVFISLVLYYSFIKIVRTAILSTNRWINLDDLNILFLVSIFLTMITLQPTSIIKYFIFIVLIIYWILLWIDGIIFYLYTFEINRQNIAEFFGDYRSMLHYSSRSVELFQRYPWIIILFPLSVVSIYTSFFRVDNAPILGFVIPIVISISIFIFQRFKQAIIRNIIALSIILTITYTFSENVLGLAK